MKKNFGILVLSLLLTLTIVNAHSNVLYDVSLDFDPEMKERVTAIAQERLELDEEPSQFDFDRELITVKFDRDREYFVSVNPSDYSVFGFRDDSLVTRKDPTMDKTARKQIADQIFDVIPESFKSELVYGEEKKLYIGTYIHTWYRYVNDVVVANDNLQVEVDGSSGAIVAWRLSPFFYLKENIKTVPAITHGVAKKIAEIEMDATPLDYGPILVIQKDKPIWLTKVKNLYPIFVAVDALNGKLVYVGSPRGEIPVDYDYGREVEVVEADWITELYNKVDK